VYDLSNGSVSSDLDRVTLNLDFKVTG